MGNNENRDKEIIFYSIAGIITNALLASFKAVIGVMTNSIAIVTDAVNNLSDALSSVITIIGAWYAKKQPDREHPLGHGRAEYLSTFIIAIIILYAGITALIGSVEKIIKPVVPEYTPTSIIVVAVAVAVKLSLGSNVKAAGKRVNSQSLVASGQDALQDAIISASTLVAACIFIIWGLSVEAYLGVVISLLIMKTGYDLLKETLSEILGERVDSALSKAIKAAANSFDEVKGTYDLILHNYGPDKYFGSIHVEVDDTLTADEIDSLSRKISMKIYQDCGVILEAIGIYSVNTKDSDVVSLKNKIYEIVNTHEFIIEIHGFRADMKEKNIYMDVIISFSCPDRKRLYDHILTEIRYFYPDYTINMALDVDISN